MKFLKIFTALSVLIPVMAFSATPIICENQTSGEKGTSIWPSFYLSGQDTLCFDVKGWPEYSGNNCVKNGKTANWTGLVIVWEDGESQGRDSTNFRVVSPIINSDTISYSIEWSRDNEWRTMQHVSVNRLTGGAVSYFVNEHGGESYQCRASQKAF
ncbi:hypothetical protein [Providencia huaxiensis]|uniref:hypothetical protein n=1 Tax=Providencia huaxiensis TaxID=2027290 RepID=UPI001B37C999|nr:hypothetical protein [Providencia huaxiensis]MBQ0533473.1 hypothetical protein [Providencia huaxiensis]MBQ0587030.1 hypothetical protein [Providencia huaxiensis]MDI7238288.1 hypothetical protein [Providencia huaxiensis]